MSIGRMFLCCMAIAALIVALVAGQTLVRDALDYRAHVRAIKAGGALDAALRLAEVLATERGPTFRLLDTPSGDRRELDDGRVRTAAALQVLRGNLARLSDSSHTPTIARIVELRALLNDLERSRIAVNAGVDAGLARGGDPSLAVAYAGSAAELQRRIIPLLNGLQTRVAVGAVDAAAVIQIARFAADLREIAGAHVSGVTAAIIDGRRLRPEEAAANQQLQGEIRRLRSQIDAAIAYVGSPPALDQAWRLAQTGYFGRGLALIDQALAQATVPGRAPFAMAPFIQDIRHEMAGLVTLRDAAIAAAIAEASRSRDDAAYRVGESALVLISMVAMVILLTAWFRRRVVLPLTDLAVKVKDLAVGGEDIDAGLTGRNDEIGGLARAMQQFRLTLIENQILHRQLLQSQKMEAIGTMAGGVAHELNNLLQPILMLTEFLGDRFPGIDDEGREDIAMIVDHTRRARDIVKNIVTFARKGSSEQTMIDLADEMRGADKLLRSLLPTTVSIEARIADDRCPALVNRTELLQVVTNLVVNAAQAMNQQGTVTLVLDRKPILGGDAAALQISPGDYATLSVIDTGCGIDPALHDRIFEPFFTTKPPGQGTGLGLSVAYGLVRAWKGTLRVKSQPGQGTTLSCLVPLCHPLP